MLHAAVQAFIDDVHGAFFATILHWVGAFAFTAGVILLALFLAQRRREPAAAERAPVLPAVLILGGILVNLVGGFARLWASDHPGLAEVGHSRWVQALAAKHAALALGMGASVVLLAAATPAVRARVKRLAALLTPSRTEALAAVAVLGVAAATIVGALVTTIVPPGAAGAASAGFPELDEGDLAWERTSNFDFSGRLTGTPVQAAASQHALSVPLGATAASFQLAWRGAVTELTLEMRDPAGEVVAPEATTSGTQLDATLDAPVPGTWAIVVGSQRAVDEPYNLAVEILQTARASSRYEQVIEVPAGEPVEIEIELAPGERVRYDYYLASGTEGTFAVHRDDAGGEGGSPPSSDPTAMGRIEEAAGGHYGFLVSSQGGSRAGVRLVGNFAVLSAPGAAPPEGMGDGHAH